MNAPSSEIRVAGRPKEHRPGPPHLPFVLAVGVTGHREESLPEGSVEPLRQRIRDALVELADAGAALLQREQACFAHEPPRLRFVSPIADGADQMRQFAKMWSNRR